MSMTRPGVPTTTAGFRFSRSAWMRIRWPPYTGTTLTGVKWLSFRRSSPTCTASSLVGARIRVCKCYYTSIYRIFTVVHG